MLIFLPRYLLFPYIVRVHLTTHQGGRYYAHFTDEETDSESLPQTHTLTKNIWGQNSNQSLSYSTCKLFMSTVILHSYWALT